MPAATRSESPLARGYFALVSAFPLKPIHNDQEHDAAIAVVDGLLERIELAPDEEDYLDVLSRLIEDYEDKHMVVPAVTGVAMLHHLMEENGLRQRDLAELLGGKSVVSEILAGKRGLSKRHIQQLSAHFGLPTDVFLDTRPPSERQCPHRATAAQPARRD